MPRTPTRPPAARPATPTQAPLSPAGRITGWGVYAVLVLISFCFGVWAGNQRPKPTETTQANPPAAKPPENATPTPPATTPEPPPQPTPPAVTPTPPEPEKKPEPVAVVLKTTPAPKKPAPKTTPAPKTPAPATPAVTEVLFAKDIQPIFRAKCTICHGDTKGPKGGLDLKSLASALKGGDNGIGAKPGDLKSSQIWATIEDGTMPPAGKEQLTPAEKKLIENWILSGAK